MQVLFSSGDVGGARALFPVIALCDRKKIPFMVLEHGDIIHALKKTWKRVSPAAIKNGNPEDIFKKNNIGLLVFSTSVKDKTTLQLARYARKQDISIIHVLDNWTGYRTRLEMDGQELLMPDIYAVIDDVARSGAIQDGIDPDVIRVTGQPAMAGLGLEIGKMSELKDERSNPAKILIAFISEPVENDQGNSDASPLFRGYTEKKALRLFAESLQNFSEMIEVAILPHPREDAEALQQVWQDCRGVLQGSLVNGKEARGFFLSADAVAGMASILLYEAWLLGKPVASIQPGLRTASLRMLQERKDVLFIENEENSALLNGWIKDLRPGQIYMARPEKALHEMASENIVSLIKEFLQ